jgi:hypothetical protein
VLADGVVAYDIPTSQAQDDANKGWLALFSSRLSIGSTPAGTPWIWYR